MASRLLVLQIVSFLDLMSIGLILPQLGNHAKELGFTYLHLGLMGALYSACQTISAPIIGSLSDIRGTKPIFVLCLAVCTFSYYWLGVTSSIFVFFVLRGLLGTFKQTQLLLKAAIAEYGSNTKEQGVLYGKLIAIAGFGMSVGPVISGHVVEYYPKEGFRLLSILVGCIFALNTVLISLTSFKSKDKKENKEENVKKVKTPSLLQTIGDSLKESVNEFYKVDWPKFWDIFLFKIVMALTMGLYFSNFALFLTSEHGVSPMNLGYIVAFQGVVGSLSNFLISYINKFYKTDSDYSLRVLHILLVMTLSLIGLAYVSNMYLYIAILVPKSICSSVGRVVSLEVTSSRSDPSQIGAVMGVSNSVKSMTGVITPIIGGIISQYLGITYAFYVAAFVNALGFVVFYNNRLKTHSKKEK